LKALDDILGGFYPGELILLGGRPSMGKSALASCCATAVARSGGGVLFCSLEMTTQGIALRAISEHLHHRGARVPYFAMRQGKLSEDDMRRFVHACSDISSLPIMLTPPSIRSVQKLRLSIRRAARMLEAKRTPIKLIVFDYIQIADAPGDRTIEKITAIGQTLKQAAMELGRSCPRALSAIERGGGAGRQAADDERPEGTAGRWSRTRT
jgi:replicative DNA helicase